MGQATAVGILLIFLAGLVTNYSLLLIPLIAIVAIMIILMLLAGTIRAGIIALTLVLLMLYLYLEPISIVIFVTIISIYIIVTSVMVALRKNKIKIRKPYRKLLRPLAVIFPVGYLFFSKSTVLLVLGVVVAFFMIAEALRFLRPRYLSFIYRKKEKGKISSLLLFLVASFLTILFFAKDIAILVLLFLIFGDLAAFFIGTAFGKIRIFNGKSLEGSFAFLVCCLFVGLVSLNFLDLDLFIVILGAVVATIVESIPIGEDNLTVALITALVLSTFR
jgi:dolichol kinase